ncbi:MAG: hypothetical protein AUJ49_05520 [Desulfovibrionaceae bacterium CG1_02_65_16]|nr:MAG: hypothetical protein AUJ49_05520 [Desulfovibrionaceae bacterium CG1_02_65_16]
MTQTLKLLAQMVLLVIIYHACDWFVTATGLPIPATVLGVALLFLLLLSGIVRLAHVELAADLLLKHLVFFFVPVAVGLMDWGGVFAEHGVILLAAILVSTAVPVVVVGLAAQRAQRAQKIQG